MKKHAILFVVSCSRAKLDQPAPARALYTGSMFRYVLDTLEAEAALTTTDGAETHVLILSARYGLLTPDITVAPYDMTIGHPDAVTAGVVADQMAEIIGDQDAELHALLPKAYITRVREACDVLATQRGGAVVSVHDAYAAAPGIGFQRQLVSRLRQAQSAGRATLARNPPDRGQPRRPTSASQARLAKPAPRHEARSMVNDLTSGSAKKIVLPRRTPVRLHDTGELIAAVPYLLGFRPVNSLVLVVHTGTDRQSIAATLRADIPPPDLYGPTAIRFRPHLSRVKASGVTVVIVGDGSASPSSPMPYCGLVDAVTEVLHADGLSVYHALWTTAIESDAQWWCYADPACNGQIPRGDVTPMAAHSVAAGVVTYASREEMRAFLEPDDGYPLTATGERIAAALNSLPTVAKSRKVVADAITDVCDGTWALDDDRIVDLGVALARGDVRDGCLRAEVVGLGKAVERLWADVTRALPAPYRAEPAFLLAVTACLRGDGALAGIALAVALEADSGHPGASRLRVLMDWGVGPEGVAQALAAARHDITPLHRS